VTLAPSSTSSPNGSARWPSPSGLGKSNAESGRELYMSVARVKAHASRVLEKLELNNRVQIALLAHDAGEA
jgi:DNA-binding CsgD family transcriptional regulator